MAMTARRLTLEVSGLDCADCARNLQLALSRTPGITQAEVNFATARARLVVSGDEGLAAARQTAREMGYALLEGEQTGSRRMSLRLRLTIASGVMLLAGWGLGYWGESQAISQAARLIILAAVMVGGLHTFRGAWAALRRRMLTVDVLVTLAVGGAVLIGEGLAAAQVVVLMSVGEWLEERTVARTRRAVRDLLDMAPRTVTLLVDGRERTAGRDEIRPGDILLVRPGGRIAVDGTVVDGRADVSEAAITGEARLVAKEPGDAVFAGSLNEDGQLHIRADHVGPDTTLARIGAMIEEAQSRQAPVQRLVDRLAGIFIPITLVAAASVYLVTGEPVRAVTILIGACPCALVLATPVAVFAAIGGATRRGLLIKGGLFLERLGTVTTVAFDKTGTLTSGLQQVREVSSAAASHLHGRAAGPLAPEETVLRLAAAVESASEHPVGRAIVSAAKGRGLEILPVTSFQALPGQGVRGEVGGREVLAGSARWLAAEGVQIPEELTREAEVAAESGFSVVHVAAGHTAIGLITLSDAVRPDAAEAIERLHKLGVRTTLLSGDAPGAAAHVAALLGMTSHRGGMLPGDKLDEVSRLSAGSGLAMVGDGINDAPALAAATVGIAVGRTGTELAIEAADVVMLSDDLRRVPEAIELGRRALANIKVNLALSGLAIVGLFAGASLGLVGPVAGALVHEGSALLVTLNAMRLLGRGGAQDRALGGSEHRAHEHTHAHTHGHTGCEPGCGHDHGHGHEHEHRHEPKHEGHGHEQQCSCGHEHAHQHAPGEHAANRGGLRPN